MAGAMPQKGGGSRGATIGMVASILVSVALLTVLIILFTQQEQLRNNADQAVAARVRLANAGDESSARQLFPDSGGAGKTLVGEMIRGVQLVAGAMTGDQNDSPLAARTRLRDVVARIRDEGKAPDAADMTVALGAVTIMENLYRHYTDEMKLREKLQADLAAAGEELKATIAAKEQLQQQFGDDLAAMRSKVEELQSAKSEFERLKQEDAAALAGQISSKQDALDALRRDSNEMRNILARELANREQLLDEQREALAVLRGPGAEAGRELAIALKGVGKVMRALPGDSLVHINLGRSDNVQLGMPFAVYSQDSRIPADGRGKAHIEVVSVGQRTSECRVTTPSAPDNPILVDDVVNNLVLSRNRDKKQRFCIVGQFDIDFDGQVDIRGAAAIAALVTRYGGVVVDRVDPMTDYVVVGLEPPATAPSYSGFAAGGEDVDIASNGFDEGEDEFADEGDDEFADDDEADGDDASDEEFTDEGDDSFDDEADGDVEDEGDDEAVSDADDDGGDEAFGEAAAAEPQPLLQAPAITRPTEQDPTRGPRMRRLLTDRERYDEALLRSSMFSIPRLPQDRFFNFIGLQSGREAVRALEQ